MKTTVFLLLVVTLSGQTFANEKRTIYDYEYGIFSRGTESFEEGDKSVSSGGELEKTSVIKAKLGTKFGVRYWLSRAGFVSSPTLHLIYLVPTMIDPATGEPIDKIEILQEEAKLDHQHTMAFEFANQYELVPGEYRFYVFFENQKLLEQVFQVELQ
jgi:hypothetical protein